MKALHTLVKTGLLAALCYSLPATQANTLVTLPAQPTDVPWPTQQWPQAELSGDVDSDALDAAVTNLFANVGRAGVPDTRALLVVRGGQIVFERYADGFTRDTRFHTWSMAKSYTQAVTGLLVKRGDLSLDAPAPVPEWQNSDDPRAQITLRHLLNMTSGIDNADGAGGGLGFVADVLFGAGATDVTSFAAERPLLHTPGTHWAYSTATSTVVAGVIGRASGNNAQQRLDFIQQNLLQPMGAKQTIFEFDKTGHFLGGSHVYATARDFARFGLLYLRDGVWEDQQILPQGWVDFARTPAPAGNNGTYGGHFWLNLKPQENQFELLPGGPSSVFEANGNAGQYIVIVPTHDMIIVRLGEMHAAGADGLSGWRDLNLKMAKLLAAFPALEGDNNGN